MMLRACLLACTVAGLLASGHAFAAKIAIVGARLLPVSSAEIVDGTVVVGDDGRIAAIGPRATTTVPADARRIDGTGLVVYPGLIDSDTSLGLAERDMDFSIHDVVEGSSPMFPQGRVADAFNPETAHLDVVRANGITHAVVSPGDTLPITGQSAFIRTSATGGSPILQSSLALVVNVSERAKGGSGAAPRTKMGLAAQLRQVFQDAQQRLKAPAGATASGPPDPKLDALVKHLRDKRPVVITATTSQDVAFALELKRDFGLNLVLSDVIDAQDQFDAIAAAKVPVIVGPIQLLPDDRQRYDVHFRVPAELAKRGIPFAFSSSGVFQMMRFQYPRMAQMRNLPYLAGIATGYGLKADDALKALTLAPAQIWGFDKDLGSLEVGKQAHLVISTGSPLEPLSDVRHVFIDGEEVSIESYQSRLRDRYRKAKD